MCDCDDHHGGTSPLGEDNVVAARVLGFDNVVDYVFFHHAPITIPAIIVRASLITFAKSTWITPRKVENTRC